MTDNGTVLVTGGTGRTGRRILAGLQERGYSIRPASRRSDIPFDWQDPTTWGQALSGVRRAWICYSPEIGMPGAAEAIAAFVEQAERADVERLVLLSARGEEGALRCEDVLAESGVEWTVLRSGWFAQNLSEGGAARFAPGNCGCPPVNSPCLSWTSTISPR
jgi:uncharacterized protein YbjT (DUF2867 family)